MKKIIFGILFLSLCFIACHKKNAPKKVVAPTKQGIKFVSGSFKSLMSKAKSENKPVFLDFYTSWCQPCKWMEKDVFSHEYVYELYNKKLINIKIDAEKGEGKELAQKFGIYGYPTLVFLDKEGNEISRYQGMTSISNVVGMGERAILENNALQ